MLSPSRFALLETVTMVKNYRCLNFVKGLVQMSVRPDKYVNILLSFIHIPPYFLNSEL